MLISLDHATYRVVYHAKTNFSYTVLFYDTSLPAFQLHDELVQTIDRNQITVIAGATGCGKVSPLCVGLIWYFDRMNTLIIGFVFLVRQRKFHSSSWTTWFWEASEQQQTWLWHSRGVSQQLVFRNELLKNGVKKWVRLVDIPSSSKRKCQQRHVCYYVQQVCSWGGFNAIQIWHLFLIYLSMKYTNAIWILVCALIL